MTSLAGTDSRRSAGILPGTPAYRAVAAALFLAGYATFSLLYCVQPLLPEFAQHFGVSPAVSSLSLSLSTAALAAAILAAAALSEGLGRRGLMFVSIAAAATLNLATALAPGWVVLLAMRAAEGFALGGVPAVAMTYLAEEIDPRGLGTAMGLYIAGTAFGGMSGRVVTGILAQALGWRAALGFIGVTGLAAAAGFILLLPPSRNFVRRHGEGAAFHRRAWARHLGDAAMRRLFAIGFLVMGSFVAIYNYAGFRLVAPPYGFSQTRLGLIFTIYLFGIAASSAAGALADRVGRRPVLTAGIALAAGGVALTLSHAVAAIVAGLAILTIGFFAAHAVASGWVGRLAAVNKGHASSLYLLAYYAGSSVIGSAGGFLWHTGGWPAIVLFALILFGLAGAAARGVREGPEPRPPAP